MKGKIAEKLLICITVITALVIVGYALSKHSDTKTIQVIDAYSDSDAAKIKVVLSGGIVKPGEYFVPSGTRLHELIYEAGGLKNDADPDMIDPDQILTEDCEIEISTYKDKGKSSVVKAVNSDAAASKDTHQPAATSIGTTQLCNINAATVKEFSALEGIGEKIAQRIVDYRNANGPFVTIDDLKKVKGIGTKKFDAIRDFITVGEG